MKKIILVIVAIVAAFTLYHIVQGFMDAARHDASPSAREKRLVEMSKAINAGLPQQDGELTRFETTTAGPGLRFTCVYKFPDHSVAQVDPAKLAATAKAKAITSYTNSTLMANFRKWQVELRVKYLDKDGNEITEVVVSPNDF